MKGNDLPISFNVELIKYLNEQDSMNLALVSKKYSRYFKNMKKFKQ